MLSHRLFSARHIRLLLLLLASFAACAAAAAERAVDRATLRQLSSLHAGASLRLDRFPTGPTGAADMHFERVEIYAKDAHIYVIGANGKQELPRSNRIFLRGRAADGSATRVAMALNPDGSFVEGNGSGPEGAFALDAKVDAAGMHTFSARALEATLPYPGAFQMTCGNDKVDPGLRPTAANDLSAQLHLAVSGATNGSGAASPGATAPASPSATQTVYRGAVIAIDTDSEFMSRLFTNNTTNATNWIASMFNTMNTMYEADLQVQLLVGTTFLRTSAASDPYTGLGQNTSSNTADLNLFGNYWKTNESAVPRQFAILLSGAIASSGGSCSAAGIAWINQYCQQGFTNFGNLVGSYSVNKVCTSIAIDPNGTFDARIVGHEIGHNFGASHTHCTDISNGNAPVATNTIDQCYNGESGSSCYAGATSCPSGQSSGSIMSYCNISGCGTQNQLHFHATQINSVLLPKISTNTPSCLSTNSDVIFADKFGG